MPGAREHSLNILDRFWRTQQRLDAIQETYFRRHRIDPPERRRITVLTREVLRWKGRLDLWLQSASGADPQKWQRRLLLILEIGTYELLMDAQTPAYAAVDRAVALARKRVGNHTTGLVNAILRKITRIDPTKPPVPLSDIRQKAAWYSFPEWLFRRWCDHFGERTAMELCTYFNNPPPLTIRRDITTVADGEFWFMLNQEGIQLERIPGTDRFYWVRCGGNRLRQHPWFAKGKYAFQDRASGAVVEFLNPQPGETILDVCAAPGTKSLYLAELMNDHGRIFASDVVPERVQLGQRDLERHRKQSIIWEQKDATLDTYPEADRILVDAPCTGTGVIGRRPDIKWRRRPEQIPEMAQLQTHILNHVSQYLKPNGVLVYATCTLEPEENWQVVESFLNLNKQFKIDKLPTSHSLPYRTDRASLETMPPRDRVDGMFAVRLRKTE
jgi:16S rRNA (cytosine967-C5)-methyltransferase